jgi:alkaline phosphatase
MIGDGAGYNCWCAASMYEGRWDVSRQESTQVYMGSGWVALGCSTHPLTTASKPSGKSAQDLRLVYDPKKAWSTVPDQDVVKVAKGVKQVELPAGYKWLKAKYTDSAAAATAMSTGQKTYNAAINWSDLDQPLGPTISELAKARAKSIGIVTSVQWSHGTPAGLSHAHVVDRDDCEGIAKQMLAHDVLDVIMGCGNPDYDDNGKPRLKKKTYKYVGGQETWQAIEAARVAADGRYCGFRPVSTKAEFEALLTGPTPDRVLGTAQVAQTLQQVRSPPRTAGSSVQTEREVAAEKSGVRAEPAFTVPLINTVPSLTTMTLGALHVLEKNPQGLLLIVEAGAIDWANHKHQAGRMIEEQIEFIRTIEAVVAWVEAHSNWDETLLIITADHETGLLWGPKSDSQAFDPVVDHGPRKMPGLGYNSDSHTNSLVPLFARGTGANALADLIVGTDSVRGPYVTNTAVFEVMRRAIAASSQAAVDQAASP